MATKKQQTLIKLNNGVSMPALGFGTYIPEMDSAGTATGKPDSNPDKIGEAIIKAIQVGYRHFDCAAYYANELGIGMALKKALQNGAITREELFVATKVWNTHHKRELAQQSVHESLQKLEVEYVDLMYIHWPVNFREGNDPWPLESPGKSDKVAEGVQYDYLETYHALEELVDAGKIRAIGLSNFTIEQIQRILADGRIKPAVLQVEVHVYLQQEKIENFCKQQNIALVAYSPLAAPHRDDTRVPILRDNEVLRKISAAHKDTSPQQVALAFLLQRGMAVIPRALSEQHMRSNFEAQNIKLKDDEMKQIQGLNKNLSMYPRNGWEHLKYYPADVLGN